MKKINKVKEKRNEVFKKEKSKSHFWYARTFHAYFNVISNQIIANIKKSFTSNCSI